MTPVNIARYISLVAAFVVGAVAEWRLGVAVGWDPYTAALLPIVLDVYGFAAFRTGKTPHVVGALAAMFATQTVSHLLELSHTRAYMVALAIGVSAIPPAVSLACHRMGERGDTVDAPAVPVVSAPEPEATPAVSLVTEDDTADDTTDDSGDDAGNAVEELEDPKLTLARRGRELVAQGLTKTAAARELGVTRQWLHRCMSEYGLA